MKVKEESEKAWLKTQHSKNQDHGIQASLVAQLVKNLPAMWDTWVRSPEKGTAAHSSYSSLENSMDCIVHGVAKSQT